MKPISTGRFFGSALKATMLVPPTDMPAPPTPAMARPTIRAVLFGAMPQIRLPTSKINTEMMKVILRSKYLKALPQAASRPPKVMKYAAAYQETSSRPPNSSVILGIAVPTIVCLALGAQLEEACECQQEYSLGPEISGRHPWWTIQQGGIVVYHADTHLRQLPVPDVSFDHCRWSPSEELPSPPPSHVRREIPRCSSRSRPWKCPSRSLSLSRVPLSIFPRLMMKVRW